MGSFLSLPCTGLSHLQSVHLPKVVSVFNTLSWNVSNRPPFPGIPIPVTPIPHDPHSYITIPGSPSPGTPGPAPPCALPPPGGAPALPPVLRALGPAPAPPRACALRPGSRSAEEEDGGAFRVPGGQRGRAGAAVGPAPLRESPRRAGAARGRARPGLGRLRSAECRPGPPVPRPGRSWGRGGRCGPGGGGCGSPRAPERGRAGGEQRRLSLSRSAGLAIEPVSALCPGTGV